MSVASVVNADYSTCIQDIRGHLDQGTHPTGADLRLYLAVIKNAASRLQARDTAVAAWSSGQTAQMAILQAKGTADASAEIDTADTTLDALRDAVDALSAGANVAPTFTAANGAAADV